MKLREWKELSFVCVGFALEIFITGEIFSRRQKYSSLF